MSAQSQLPTTRNAGSRGQRGPRHGVLQAVLSSEDAATHLGFVSAQRSRLSHSTLLGRSSALCKARVDDSLAPFEWVLPAARETQCTFIPLPVVNPPALNSHGGAQLQPMSEHEMYKESRETGRKARTPTGAWAVEKGTSSLPLATFSFLALHTTCPHTLTLSILGLPGLQALWPLPFQHPSQPPRPHARPRQAQDPRSVP